MYYEFQNQDCCTTYERSDLYRYLSPTRSPDDHSAFDHVRTIKRQRNRCLCSSQIYEKQSLEDITYEDDNKYTSMLLLEAIKSALAKASVLQQ